MYSKQSSMVESSFLIDSNGLTMKSPDFGQLLLTYLITLDIIGSLQNQAWISSAVTGVFSSCSVSKTNSGGTIDFPETVGRGSLLSVAAFACDLVSQNLS